jgi:uncharacterized protein DUF669
MTETSTMLPDEFDVETEEGTGDFELLPAGQYKAEIANARVGPTKNGKGQAVSITWQITEGEYDKRLLFQTVLIQHESADAQRFGRQRFRDICDACGERGKVTDLSVLYFKPCAITVGIRRDKDGQFADRNEVKRVRPAISGWNGSRKALEEATTVKAFKASKEPLNDDIPF